MTIDLTVLSIDSAPIGRSEAGRSIDASANR